MHRRNDIATDIRACATYPLLDSAYDRFYFSEQVAIPIDYEKYVHSFDRLIGTID